MDDNRQKRIALALGASIAKMRAQNNLTQEQVAEKLGVGNEVISRIERGAVMPPSFAFLSSRSFLDAVWTSC